MDLEQRIAELERELEKMLELDEERLADEISEELAILRRESKRA